MKEKVLGKITSAEFGMLEYYPFLFGLKLCFSLAESGGICDGGQYLINISPECKWETRTREKAITEMVYKVYSILEDAKVTSVSGLINKPVEVTLENNMFKEFRILTEVL